MKSKLILLPFIAFIAMGVSVNAQANKKPESANDQTIDRYQQQKKDARATFKKDMDALNDQKKRDMDVVNDQKNLTPAQREAKRKQIITSYQQQKKVTQETFENRKESLKTSVKNVKAAEKIEDRHEKSMREKHEVKAKPHENKPHTAPKVKG